jgi:hypothetical protein
VRNQRRFVNAREHNEAWRRHGEHIAQMNAAIAARRAEWKARDDLCSTCGHRLSAVGGTCAWDPTHPQ